ncbi:hypothetical protein Q7P37_003121 [Cladosporium fusiforme]
MEAIGLALSVAALADMCFKYGQKLVEMYQSVKGANAELDERIVYIKSLWLRTCKQLDVIRKIEHELSFEHYTNHCEVLQMLENKLCAACSKIDTLLKKQGTQTEGSVRRLKYSLAKPQLDETIKDLQRWQELYDPSWFLILRIASQSIDLVLPRTPDDGRSVAGSAARIRDAMKPHPSRDFPVFLSSSGLDQTKLQAIPHTSANFCLRSGSQDWVVIDRITCANSNKDILTKDVRKLATKLRNIDPLTFSILRCRGVVRIYGAAKTLHGFDLVLDTPKQTSHLPRSLRTHLMSQHPHSLSDRFNLARQIAKATNYVHTLGFVHKAIRPENVINFDEYVAPNGQFFLIGFEEIRSVDGRTQRHGDPDRFRDIYRHPARQGLQPHEDFCMQHDIYSLGVCLLEIGLWTSFVDYDSAETPEIHAAAMRLDSEQIRKIGATDLKDHLVSLARKALPMYDANDDFGDRSQFEDEDGVLVGVRYIEKIFAKLSGILI